jgi:hypothetical protein
MENNTEVTQPLNEEELNKILEIMKESVNN